MNLQEVRNFIEKLLCDLPACYQFHNIEHTREVVAASQIIADHLLLNELEKEIVALAAWFHDCGFIISRKDHELHSEKIAGYFLKERNYPGVKLQQVLDCIRATKLPQTPRNLLECVLCDADMYHLSTPQYWDKNQMLKRETQLISKETLEDSQWCFENLNFLSGHHYHTPYGQKVLEIRKKAHLIQNIKRLKAICGVE